MFDNEIYSQLADSINSAVSRRKFMQLTGIGAGTVLGGSLLAHLQAIAAPAVGPNDGILVMVYLAGGCDPLNVLTPYSNNIYRNARPTLSLSPEGSDTRGLLAINDAYGLNAALPSVHSMYMNGKVGILPGIGFGGQDLSHFSSIATYMRGWGGTGGKASGWVGRYLDSLSDPISNSSRGITINGTMPLTLQGQLAQPISLPTNITKAYLGRNEDLTTHCSVALGGFGTQGDGLINLMGRNLKDTTEVPGIYKSAYPSSGEFTGSGIEQNLAITAGIINANLGARVIHITHGSYDTHTNQLKDQSLRLGELDNGIKRFFNDLSAQYSNRVTLMVYSEFGRRLQENGTGTDHGRSSMVWLLGDNVNGGKILSDMPNLGSTDSAGNLVETTDFRSIYADITKNWLRGDVDQVIGQQYSSLGLFTAGPGQSASSTNGNTTPITQPTTPVTQPTTPPTVKPPTPTTPVTQPTTPPTVKPPTPTTPVTQPTTPPTVTVKPTQPVENDLYKLIKMLLKRHRRRRF